MTRGYTSLRALHEEPFQVVVRLSQRLGRIAQLRKRIAIDAGDALDVVLPDSEQDLAQRFRFLRREIGTGDLAFEDRLRGAEMLRGIAAGRGLLCSRRIQRRWRERPVR